jgi:hypothetical protein
MSNTSRSNAKNSNRKLSDRPGQKRRPQRRSFRRSGYIATGLVLTVLAVLIVVRVTSGSSPTTGGSADSTNGTTVLSSATTHSVTHVPTSTLDGVSPSSSLAGPQAITGSPTLLTQNGKPSVLYMGAEYCPFCAAERWPLVVALSRFGTFTGLKGTHSSSSDSYPNTPTLSFLGSTYSSAYLTFTSVEMQSNELVDGAYPTLQSPTAAEQATLTKYDVSPYTTNPGSIPFIDFGNRYVQIGASYDPGVLAGQTDEGIADELTGDSATATSIDGTANLLTAAICKVTGNTPKSVCTDSVVTLAARALAG